MVGKQHLLSMSKLSLSVLSLLVVFLTGCQAPQTVPLPTSPQPTHTQPPASTQLPTPTSAPTPEFLPTLVPPADESQKITLMAVGDIMLGRTIGEMIETEGPQAPFAFTAEILSSADLTLGNLECPISSRGSPEEKTYTFRAPLLAGEALAMAGFDVLSLANNHVLDYGIDALEDTLNILNDRQIYTVGAGMNDTLAYAPLFLEINGLRLAVLAFADIPATDYDYTAWEAGADQPGIAWAHPHILQERVKQAKQAADVVIVLVHNGYEIVQRVSKQQQEFAHLAIDSGASLVIGSHPHVLQRIENYNNGLIVYSMGNFVFDNFLFPPNYSAILQVDLSPEGVESYKLIDVIIQLNGVPQIMPYKIPED